MWTVSRGVAAVCSSRVTFGFTGRNVEVNDAEAGIVAPGDLDPAKARVLLELLLLETSDPVIVQKCFDRY